MVDSEAPRDPKDRISSRGATLILGALLIIAVIVGIYSFSRYMPQGGGSESDLPPLRRLVIPEKFKVQELLIKKKDDAGKGGTLHSRIIGFSYHQEPRTNGLSPDRLAVEFDSDVEIVGVWISIDFDPNCSRFELAGTINSTYGYENNTPQKGEIKTHDALIHVSWNGGLSFGLDEHIWFGKGGGFELSPEDDLLFGAWMTNKLMIPYEVWPEIIVYYRWL